MSPRILGMILTYHYQAPKFRPNDEVKFINSRREGIFKVKDVNNKQYRLLDGKGVSVEGGVWFKESDLELEEDEFDW